MKKLLGQVGLDRPLLVLAMLLFVIWGDVIMNKKAEKFKKYLDTKKIEAFTIEEIEKDELNTVAFRSHLEINGSRLPVVVILDSSIYGMIRILVAPKVLREEAELPILQLVNSYNKKYKSFKYYIDDEGSLVLDTCILFKEGEADGDMVYAMFEVLIDHLNESYKDIMKAIWG